MLHFTDDRRKSVVPKAQGPTKVCVLFFFLMFKQICSQSSLWNMDVCRYGKCPKISLFIPCFLGLNFAFYAKYCTLTLKAPSKICSRRHFEIFFFNFSKKTSLDISCELSAWQTIHMKYQDLFSLKN